MKFGDIPVERAKGALLAHSLVLPEKRFSKAHCLNEEDIAILERNGVRSVCVARLDSDDLDENAAAQAIASSARTSAIHVKPPTTGRVNFHASASGLFGVDAGLIDAINAVDPAITIATLAHHSRVEAGQLVATIKIIPYAVAGHKIGSVTGLCAQKEIFRVRPFFAKKVGLIQSLKPGVKSSVLDKTRRITQMRLERSSSGIHAELRVDHEVEAIRNAIRFLGEETDLVIIYGASAMADFDDVIPGAIRQAGGRVIRAGMPVDPGNLLVLGEAGGKFIIGAPGCARSPKENGFDWVLDRLIAGVEVSGSDISRWGVGGLLKDIPDRPEPREILQQDNAIAVHAIVLAAGRSRRMAGSNKLTALLGDKPLIRQTVENAVASCAEAVSVITGYQAEQIEELLTELPVTTFHNPDYASGLSSSLKTGIRHLPASVSGALIMLGDMPMIEARQINHLIARFVEAKGQCVVRAAHDGKRGNPVILPRSLFSAVFGLEGDAGARRLIEESGIEVIDVEVGPSALIDIDTKDDLFSLGGSL